MQWAVETIQKEMETPICIDSADSLILEAGLKARNGRLALINSVKADDKNLEKVIRLAEKYNTPLIALAMDASGIPKTAEDRILACQKTVLACQRNGFSVDNLFFDPLVLPISSDAKQGILTLKTISMIKDQFPTSKTIIGLSNISYGLPERDKLNAGFLQIAIYEGLDAVILDPLKEEIMDAIKTAEAIAGKDRHFRRFMRSFRNNR